jgi:hypothetical protein
MTSNQGTTESNGVQCGKTSVVAALLPEQSHSLLHE